jgi:hypothetical protein
VSKATIWQIVIHGTGYGLLWYSGGWMLAVGVFLVEMGHLVEKH